MKKVFLIIFVIILLALSMYFGYMWSFIQHYWMARGNTFYSTKLMRGCEYVIAVKLPPGRYLINFSPIPFTRVFINKERHELGIDWTFSIDGKIIQQTSDLCCYEFELSNIATDITVNINRRKDLTSEEDIYVTIFPTDLP